MKTILSSLFCFLLASCSYSQNSIRWDLDSLDKIGGYNTTVYGSPTLINTTSGKAIEFDGVDDGLFVANNPMKGLTEFTIEAIFKPYSGGNFEQRWIHFQQDDNNRILVELRYADNSWYLDTYIKSGASARTLNDATKIHGMDKWYHIALTYKDSVMTHYVDGVQEGTGAVTYATVNSGQTSLGVRQTLVNYFKGALKTIKVTDKALATSEFISQEAIELNGPLAKDETSFQEQTIGLVFPSPAKDQARLGIGSLSGKQLRAQLTNSMGESVQTMEILPSHDQYELEIKRNNLPAGIYYLQIQTENKAITRAVVFE